MGPAMRRFLFIPALLATALSVTSASAGTPPTDAARSVQKEAETVGPAAFTAPDYHPGLVRHMVMFRLKPGTTEAQRQMVISGFRDLASLSRRPDGTHVISALETGIQNSGEGADLGLQLGFLVTFRSEGDRNYYVGRPVVTRPGCFDPAHDHYKQTVGPYLEKVVVFDYVASPVPAPQ